MLLAVKKRQNPVHRIQNPHRVFQKPLLQILFLSH